MGRKFVEIRGEFRKMEQKRKIEGNLRRENYVRVVDENVG